MPGSIDSRLDEARTSRTKLQAPSLHRPQRSWHLGVPVESNGQPLLQLDDGEVRFEQADSEREQGITEIAVETPRELPGAADVSEVDGVRLRRLAAA